MQKDSRGTEEKDDDRFEEEEEEQEKEEEGGTESGMRKRQQMKWKKLTSFIPVWIEHRTRLNRVMLRYLQWNYYHWLL